MPDKSGVYPSQTPGRCPTDRKSYGKTRLATAHESERSVRRWPGHPGNSVEGSIAAFWQSAVVSMANRLSISPQGRIESWLSALCP
jgi:hypothetical protein